MIGGAFMLLGIPFSIYFKSNDLIPLLAAGATTIFFGFIMWLSTKNAERSKIKKREAFLIVGLSYFGMSLFGMLPYLFSGAIPNVTNAFFESVSGITTTGASILNDIEACPPGILFWRSITQWLGGMGIILLTIAILPYFGIGGMELFVAEVPGPTKEKLHPRINETAKRLWYIYLALTGILTVLLFIEGMSFFDAINHALTTTSSGGYSTKQASIGHFDDPIIHYTIILFMFLAGTNFTLIYFGFKGRFKDIFNNEEFRFYLSIVAILTLIVSTLVVLNLAKPIEPTIRHVLFSIVSLLTTTGYATVDYTKWFPFITLIFFALLFLGGSAGSTSGGVKLVRHLMLLKNSVMEFKRILHPRAIIPVRYNKHVVDQQLIYNILAFFVAYMVIFGLSSLIMASMGIDLLSAMSAVATSIGNVGPGIDSVGPSENFNNIPALGKWYLGFLMILGRLELFTILIIFTPFFWKRN